MNYYEKLHNHGKNWKFKYLFLSSLKEFKKSVICGFIDELSNNPSLAINNLPVYKLLRIWNLIIKKRK